MLRLTRSGITGSAIFLVLSAAWLVLARPPGSRIAYELWFVLLLIVGAHLPGPANQVTLARAYLAPAALVYALGGSTLGLLAVVVAIAGATDLIDGAVARRLGAPTQLGGGLDPVVDGIFFGSTAAGLAAGGACPWWLAGVVVVRYALPALAGGGLLLAGRRPELRHSLLGQASTVVIAGLLGLVALLRGLGQDAAWLVGAASILIPVAALATFGNLAWDARGSLPRGGSRPAPGG